MATIAITVTETGQTTLTKTFTFTPDSQLDRMITSYQSAANISVNGTATRAQVLNYWAQLMINQAKANVLGFENAAATATAVATVTPITPT